MSRITIARLALLSLAGLVPFAVAQQNAVNTVNASTIDCGSSASRTSAPCSAKDQVVIRHETELTTTFEVKPLKFVECQADIGVQYHQRNTAARVEGTIENKTCAASSGEYSVAIRIKDEAGESKTLEFRESWQRSDDRPISVATDDPIGANVDLVSVRARSLHCVCAEQQ
jgi:hypothetical protein